MFPSSADYARRHMGRVLMLATGAAVSLTLAAAIDVPSVKAVDSEAAGVLGGFGGAKASRRSALMAGDRLADILDRVADGRTVVWRNPETQVTYRIHPLASFKADGRDCRTFTIRRTAGGSVRESYRTACRGSDGAWSIITAPDAVPNG